MTMVIIPCGDCRWMSSMYSKSGLQLYFSLVTDTIGENVATTRHGFLFAGQWLRAPATIND
jgi:hypothetical protein